MTPQSTFQAELASHADFPWCAQVMAATDPWLTLRHDPAACEADLHRPGSDLFIARRGNERIGFVLLTTNGLAGSPYIAAIAVAENVRGQGVGSELLTFAERRFPEARNIFLCVSDFNVRAQALYRRCGYKQVGLLEDYVLEGHAELLMRKRLK